MVMVSIALMNDSVLSLGPALVAALAKVSTKR
jgi:hypothetical protein